MPTSVLPTPACPSINRGFPSWITRYTAVARARSSTYPDASKPRMTASISRTSSGFVGASQDAANGMTQGGPYHARGVHRRRRTFGFSIRILELLLKSLRELLEDHI